MANASTRSVHDAANTSAPFRRDWTKWAGPAALAVLFVALTVWSWRRWGDIAIDYGQQLYVAWQILEGKDLYRDIAWPYGPLSSYVNALLFRLFGVSYTTLVLCNLALLAVVCALVYRLLDRLCDRLAATLAVLALLTVFGFAHFVILGNYNFIAPYTHEATHGTLICLVLLACVVRRNETRSSRAAIAIGTCVGLSLWTKPEIVLAAFTTASWGIGLLWWIERPALRQMLRELRPIAAGAALAAAAIYALLAARTSAAEALVSLGRPWLPLLESDIVATHYFASGLGIDLPWANLAGMAIASLALASGLTGLAAVDARLSLGARSVGWRQGLTAVVVFGALITAFPTGPWETFGKALPVLTLAAFCVFTRAALRARDPREVRRFVALSAWGAFALAFLAKMVLNARLRHYGFFLAMPATTLLIATLAWWVPEALRRNWGRGSLFRAAVVATVVAAAVAHVAASHRLYARKDFAFGRGSDVILAPSGRSGGIGPQMQQGLLRIEEWIEPGESFLALPYGIMLNYQSRRPSPSRYLRWTGLEFVIYGEENMIATLEEDPPEWILLVHSASQAEFGLGPFGRDPLNGRQLLAWIRAHYSAVD
ncbi:MAG: glycosyltransferase family 39 protein, partial [Myxococcota bacterium]